MNPYRRDCYCADSCDNTRLPLMTERDNHELGPWTAQIQESSSSSCLVTDGSWFGRANIPDATDTNLTTSLVYGGPWSQSCLISSSSSGSLVCPPAVLMPPSGEVFENTCLGVANSILSDNSHAHEASQAPRQWCENTDGLESLMNIPQVPMLYTNRSNLSHFSNSSRHCGCHNPPIDPILQLNALPLALPGFGSMGTANLTENLDNLQSSTLQSQNNDGNTFGFDNDDALLPTLDEPSFDTLIESPCVSILNGSLAKWDSSQIGSNDLGANQNLSEASTGSKKKSGTGKYKVVKLFACFHCDCPFTATSRKDFHRHLRSDKHQKDHIPGASSEERFYCEVVNCKSAQKGFSRRDNMLRHMSLMHNIELDREKRGRKRK